MKQPFSWHTSIIVIGASLTACDCGGSPRLDPMDSGSTADAAMRLPDASDGASVDSTVPQSNVLSLHVTPSYEAEPFILSRPETIELLLIGVPESDGAMDALLASVSDSGAKLTEVVATRDGTSIELSSSEVVVSSHSGKLGWDSLSLSLEDATGEVVGDWRASRGDVIDQTQLSGTINVSPDDSPGSVWFLPADVRSRDRLLPTDSIRVRFDEPIAVTSLDALTLLVDGTEATGSFVAGAAGFRLMEMPLRGMVTAATFESEDALPFGSELALSTERILDGSGNAIVWDNNGLATADDPGSASPNLGFEAGLNGWIASGAVEVVGASFGVDIAEGSFQVLVREESSLVGYLDVPEAASSLTLRVALLSEIGEIDPGHTAVIKLLTQASEATVIDLHEERDAGVSGDYGDSFQHRIGPLDVSADLTPFRGQRVALIMQARSGFFIGVNSYGLLVDDIRVM